MVVRHALLRHLRGRTRARDREGGRDRSSGAGVMSIGSRHHDFMTAIGPSSEHSRARLHIEAGVGAHTGKRAPQLPNLVHTRSHSKVAQQRMKEVRREGMNAHWCRISQAQAVRAFCPGPTSSACPRAAASNVSLPSSSASVSTTVAPVTFAMRLRAAGRSRTPLEAQAEAETASGRGIIWQRQAEAASGRGREKEGAEPELREQVHTDTAAQL